jgi:hypothetical protein
MKKKLQYYDNDSPFNSSNKSKIGGGTTTLSHTSTWNDDALQVSTATNNIITAHASSLVDPLALKRGIAKFLKKTQQQQQQSGIQYHPKDNDPLVWWYLLENYHVYDNNNNNNNNIHLNDSIIHYANQYYLSSNIVCNIEPGKGIEQDAGFILLANKIRIYNQTATTLAATATRQQQQQQQELSRQSPRLLCMMYTYSPMRYLARVQAITWGRHCDGFVAFSNETIIELGIFAWNNPHDNNNNNNNNTITFLPNDEAYSNLWQKVVRCHEFSNFLWLCYYSTLFLFIF